MQAEIKGAWIELSGELVHYTLAQQAAPQAAEAGAVGGIIDNIMRGQ